MFFWKKKYKKNEVEYCKVDSIILKCEGKHYNIDAIELEFQERHYELDMKKQIVRYRNFINGSRDGGRGFPKGYFKEKISKVDTNKLVQMTDVFVSLSKKVDFKRKKFFQSLPPGAALDAFIGVTSGEMKLYYTNTHVRGRSVESDPIPDDFIALVHLLDGCCEFPKDIPVITPIKYPREVIDHLNQTFKSNDVEVIIGYKCFRTGVVDYEFYCEKTKIGNVTGIVSLSPLNKTIISGCGYTWESEFENCTIYPGITRYVLDAAAQTLIARLVYRDIGKYELNESIIVYCDENKYSFFCDEEIVAQIIPYKGKVGDQLIEGDSQPYFKILADKGISNELKVLVVSFPMLRF